ncbi:MAG: DUF1289 domain-containing protein [Kiloniellales bacterium]
MENAISDTRSADMLAGDRQTRRAERRRRVREGLFDTSIPSPCIAVCQMDADNRFCIGCHRNLDEIRDWMIMTTDEKQSVIDRIENLD